MHLESDGTEPGGLSSLSGPASFVRPADRFAGLRPQEIANALNLASDRERQVPFSLDGVEPTHSLRYHDLVATISGSGREFRNALDFGCGAGYGSRILAQAAERVIGADINRQTLEYAAAVFGDPEQVKFTTPDRIPSGMKFDLIACVETIEHMPLEEGRKLLAMFRELLEPRGVLYLTTPRRPYGNPFHLHEYDFGEIVNEVGRAGFKVWGALGQAGSRIDAHCAMEAEYRSLPKYTMLLYCGGE